MTMSHHLYPCYVFICKNYLIYKLTGFHLFFFLWTEISRCELKPSLMEKVAWPISCARRLPIDTSKLMGLSPIFRSIMVASKNAPKSKNSSYFSGTIYRKKKYIWDRPGFLYFIIRKLMVQGNSWSRVIHSLRVSLKRHIHFPLIR